MVDEPEVTVNAETIPDELKARDQWLFWNASSDKPRKPLAEPDADHGASWTDPDDWVSFDEAVEKARDVPSAGIGYVFAAGNDDYPRGLYGGLDLDGCVVEHEHGRKPKDWLPSLEPFGHDTYIEFSPSGEGIHIPLVGFEVPEWWSNAHFTAEEHEGVEAYDSKFFTFTGDTLDISTDEVGDVDLDAVEDWLAGVYEEITGDDPRVVNAPEPTGESRETQKSRDEVSDIETTNEYDDVLDAVDHLRAHDLPLRSSKTEDEAPNWESWDPAYRQSDSGTSLKRNTESGIFLDFSEASPDQCTAFGPLDLFAAEEGIIRRPYDQLKGEDWHEAVDRAREQGAPIPGYAGVDGDMPEDEALGTDDGQTQADEDRLIWEAWSRARENWSLDEEAVIPTPALRHIVREHLAYDLDQVPDDADGLPWYPHNQALSWLVYTWARDAFDADPSEIEREDVTARSYASYDPDDAHSWDAVRKLYGENKEQGRYAAVRLLRDRNEFLTPEDTEELHIYNDDLGVYEIGAVHEVGRTLDRNLQSHYSTHEKNEILSRLKEIKYDRDELEGERFDGTYVCVENGVLDVHTRELHEHGPEWLFTRHLPVEYDPEAECPAIRDFLQDITRREEDWRTMVEMLGNALLPHYDYESFMVLFGRGANGKSTWLNVVRDFLGHDNIENVPLQDLSDNRFAPAQLVGKWANIGGDLPEKKIHDMGTLKDLTGGGEVWAEKKGEDGFNFENRAKLMFAANEPPVLGERNHAVARRILPIRLPNRYTPDPDDEHKDRIDGLEEQLTTEDELSGLLNLALAGIERLDSNSDFSLPESPEERLEYYEQFSDHIKMFAVNCLNNEAGEREGKSEVYNAYTAFCNEKGREPSTKQTFWNQLRKTTLDISIVRPQLDDGSRPRMADNLTFSEHGQQFAPNYETPDHETPTVSSLAPGSDGVTVEGRIESVDTEQPDQLAEKAELVDVTDSITVTVWADSNKPALQEGQAYRLKNVQVTKFEGKREIQVGQNTGIEELSPGVGNVPAADPGSNEQLDAAADGGEVTSDDEPSDDNGSVGSDDEIVNLEPKAVQYVRKHERDHSRGVPHDMVFGHLVAESGDPDAAEHAIDKALRKGRLEEPSTDAYRSVK